MTDFEKGFNRGKEEAKYWDDASAEHAERATGIDDYGWDDGHALRRVAEELGVNNMEEFKRGLLAGMVQAEKEMAK